MNAPASTPKSPADHALAYASLGWHVFPCRQKRPLTERGFLDASTDAAQISRWWAEHPDAEIGWVPGLSQHVVVDLDVPKNGGGDGREAFAQIAGVNSFATSLVATTPSGGRHLVYRAPAGRSYGMVNLKRMGIDVRGQNGYVILPDGRHGREWEDGAPLDVQAALAPPWLTDWLDVTVGPARESGQPRAFAAMPEARTATDERLEEVRSALLAIEATVGRRDWLKLIFAVHDALAGDAQGADLVEEWSSRAEVYDPRTGSGQYRKGEAFRAYAEARPAIHHRFQLPEVAAVTARTLFALASARGWKRRERHPGPGLELAGAEDAAAQEPPRGLTEMRGGSNWADAIRLQDWNAVAELPMVRWQILRLVPERSLVLLAGDTMMGKSFVAIDLAMRLVHAKPFFERKVRPCSVLYLCGEGQQGLAARFRLWRQQHSATDADAEGRFCLVSNRIPELGPSSFASLRELLSSIVKSKGHAPGLVIVDTLSQALEGDENDAADTAPVIRALARLRDEFDCTILIVHHTAKRDPRFAFDRSGGERWIPVTLDQVRGSGAITRNLDTVLGIQLSRDSREVQELVTLKQKDGGIGLSIRFRRVVAPTGRTDEDGEPESSCVLVPAVEVVGSSGVPVGKVEAEALREAETEGINRLVDVLKREGRLSSRDTIVGAAGLNAKKGRAYLDLALTRGAIVDVGHRKRPVFVLPEAADQVRRELDEAARARRKGMGESPPVTPRARRTDSPLPGNPSNPSNPSGTDWTDSENRNPRSLSCQVAALATTHGTALATGRSA